MNIQNQIEYRSPEDLFAHPLNDQYHSPLNEREYMTLFESIKELGVQEPLWITPAGTIISGHERWKIAQKQQIKRVPVRVVTDATDQELLYLLVSANEARRGTEKDLIKKAKKIKVLYDYFGVRHGNNQRTRHAVASSKEAATIAGLSTRTLQRLLKLLELIPELQELVSKRVIGLTAGNELAALPEGEQERIYQKIKQNNIKEIKTAEIQAIRKELEYIRERDLNRNQRNGTVQPIQEDETMEIEFVSSDLEEEEKETISLDDNPNEQENEPQPREEATADDRPWHSTLEAPKRTIDAVSPIFEDDANAVNVRKRLFMDQVRKAEKQIDSVCRNLVPFFDLIIDHPDAIIREEMNSLLQKIEDLNSQLEEVVDWNGQANHGR